MVSIVLRLDGLPFKLSVGEVEDFFTDHEIPLEKVHLLLNRQSRPSGTGFVVLPPTSDVEKVLELDGKCIGDTNRYARIVRSEDKELSWYLKRQESYENSASMHCVRMYGLPYKVNEYEVAKWFEDADVDCIDVQIFLNYENRSSGEAMAYFRTAEEAGKALKRNKADMNGRYIDLSMDNVSVTFDGGADNAEGKFMLRMKGVPFRTTEEELKAFFQPAATCLRAKVILNKSGRPSGDAMAEFESEEELEAAMSRDRQHIGPRFVLLQRVHAKGYLNDDDDDVRSQHAVKIHGLPYSATVEDIKQFFMPEANCCKVTILMNRSNSPSGDAIAEFTTREDVDAAVAKNRKYIGNRFVIITPYEGK